MKTSSFFSKTEARSRRWSKKNRGKRIYKTGPFLKVPPATFSGEDIIIWWAGCWWTIQDLLLKTTHSQKATMKDWRETMNAHIYIRTTLLYTYIYRYVWFILITYFLYVLIMYKNTYSDVCIYINTYVYMSHISSWKYIYTQATLHIYIYVYIHILVWLKVFPSIGWMIGTHPIVLASSSSHHGIFFSRKCMWMSLMLGFSSTNVWYSHRTTPVWVEPGCQRAWLTAAMRWIWMMRICSFSLVFRDTCWFFGAILWNKNSMNGT